MHHPRNRTAIYARKSSESEDRQVLSIESQVRELTDLARRDGKLVAPIFTEAKSAKSPGRPVFNELFKQVQSGKIDSVVCWKLDRLARNPIDGGAVIWAMEEGKLQSIHTPGRTFLNTGNDKFWMQLEFGMAKKYVDDLSDNVKRGMRAKLEQGWLPGLPPLGYLNDRNNRTIVQDPERFPLIRRMWDMMLSGSHTPPQILRVATEQWGLRTRTFKREGGGPLIESMVHKIFRNPFYYGVIRRRGEDYPGSHAPMVTKAEFESVQELLSNRHRHRPQRKTFAFTGLMTCGECGASITAEHKRNRHGHTYIYYHCSKRKAGIKCSQRVIEARELDAQMRSFIEKITISPTFKNWAVALVREVHSEEMAKDRAAWTSLNHRYEACKQELSKLVDLRLRGLLTDTEYLAKKSQLVSEQTELQEQLRDRDGRFTEVMDRCLEAFDFASTVKDLFTSDKPGVKRACARYLGSNLILRDKKLSILPHKPFEILLNVGDSSSDRIHRFEPEKVGQDKARTDHVVGGNFSWWALRDEVRKLFRHPPREFLTNRLPDVLKVAQTTLAPPSLRTGVRLPAGHGERTASGCRTVPSPTAQPTSPIGR